MSCPSVSRPGAACEKGLKKWICRCRILANQVWCFLNRLDWSHVSIWRRACRMCLSGVGKFQAFWQTICLESHKNQPDLLLRMLPAWGFILVDAFASFAEPVAGHNTRVCASKIWPKPDGSKAKTTVHWEYVQWPFPHSFSMKKCHLFLMKRPVQEDTANLLAAVIVYTSWKLFFFHFFFWVAWSNCPSLSSHSKFSTSSTHTCPLNEETEMLRLIKKTHCWRPTVCTRELWGLESEQPAAVYACVHWATMVVQLVQLQWRKIYTWLIVFEPHRENMTSAFSHYFSWLNGSLNPLQTQFGCSKIGDLSECRLIFWDRQRRGHLWPFFLLYIQIFDKRSTRWWLSLRTMSGFAPHSIHNGNK